MISTQDSIDEAIEAAASNLRRKLEKSHMKHEAKMSQNAGQNANDVLQLEMKKCP